MALTAEALRELHRIHRQLAELRDRRERGPKQVAAREANLAKLTAALEQIRNTAKQTRLAVDRKQLDLKTGEQKIVDLRAKLNTAASNKEYQALLEQIAAAEMAGSVLSDEILEGLEKIDEIDRAVGEAAARCEGGRQEVTKTKDAMESSIAAIQTDIQRLETQLAHAEASLPPEVRADYERIVRSKGAEGLAEVEDGVCTGCGRQITLNMQNELKLSRMVFCKTCGCLLYPSEP
jgi:predicted  nucleic acid-binding Zn-ribbon protein